MASVTWLRSLVASSVWSEMQWLLTAGQRVYWLLCAIVIILICCCVAKCSCSSVRSRCRGTLLQSSLVTVPCQVPGISIQVCLCVHFIHTGVCVCVCSLQPYRCVCVCVFTSSIQVCVHFRLHFYCIPSLNSRCWTRKSNRFFKTGLKSSVQRFQFFAVDSVSTFSYTYIWTSGY